MSQQNKEKHLSGASWVCQSCRQTTTEPKRRGYGWIELILWLCYIVPGLIYSIWRRSGAASVCPTCSKETLILSTIMEKSRSEVECPFCAELILAKAVRCKHCHKDLPRDEVVQIETIIEKTPDIIQTDTDVEGETSEQEVREHKISFGHLVVMTAFWTVLGYFTYPWGAIGIGIPLLLSLVQLDYREKGSIKFIDVGVGLVALWCACCLVAAGFTIGGIIDF